MSSADAELDGLRKQLEAEKVKEVYLEDELAHPDHPAMPAPAPAAVAVPAADKAPSAQDRERIAQVLHKKNELETKIRDYEDLLKQGEGVGRASIEKKKIIRDIVQADAHNQGLRQNIAQLREDVALLRDQIGKLERRSGLVGDNRIR